MSEKEQASLTMSIERRCRLKEERIETISLVWEGKRNTGSCSESKSHFVRTLQKSTVTEKKEKTTGLRRH